MTFQSDMETGFTAVDLRAWIEKQGGVLWRQEGSHLSFKIDRPGSRFHNRIVPCIDKGQPVSRNLTAHIAGRFERDRGWLLDQLGVERHKGGRIKKGLRRQPAPAVRKQDVLDSIAEVRASLAEVVDRLDVLDHDVRCGIHDPAFYRLKLGEVADLRRSVLGGVA